MRKETAVKKLNKAVELIQQDDKVAFYLALDILREVLAEEKN